MSSKKILAPIMIGAISLFGLTACSDSSNKAQAESPTPAKTTPAPKKTTPTPSPTPTKKVYTFEVQNEDGYIYEYKVTQLPEFYGVIDTTKGPPGYTMVKIGYKNAGSVQITNKTPGGKEAPLPGGNYGEERTIKITPLWNPDPEILDKSESEEHNAFAKQDILKRQADYDHPDYKPAYYAWDGKNNNIKLNGEEFGDRESWYIGSEIAMTYFSYEGETYESPYIRNLSGNPRNSGALHGFLESSSRTSGDSGLYIVKEDQAEAFVNKMLNPDGFTIMGPYVGDDGDQWIKDGDGNYITDGGGLFGQKTPNPEFYKNHFFIPREGLANNDVSNTSIDYELTPKNY